MKAGQQKRLRIAMVAPLWARVPPVDYGGTELRLSWLTEELVARGHSVTLYASGDSRTSARLRAVCPRNLMDAMQAGEVDSYSTYMNAGFAEAIRDASSYDLIHLHGEVEHAPFGANAGVPFICSLRSALSSDDIWLLQRYEEVHFVAMSRSQIRNVPEGRRRAIPVIYNGCNFDDYAPAAARGEYLVFLGRMGPHKDPVAAVQIAREVGRPIVLAGKPQDAREAVYFERQVRPLIDGRAVKYIGAVNQKQKRDLLGKAAALLFPIRWEEPFGIVMIEAMASGVPVVASNRGSVAEVVDCGVTGYFGDSTEELSALVAPALRLDRVRVREHAKQRFSHQRMVESYLRLYGVWMCNQAGKRDVQVG